jgi:hypothetical protein
MLTSATQREAQISGRIEASRHNAKAAEVLAAELYEGYREGVWRELIRMSRKEVHVITRLDHKAKTGMGEDIQIVGCSAAVFRLFMNEKKWQGRCVYVHM